MTYTRPKTYSISPKPLKTHVPAYKTEGPVALRDSFQVKGPAQETPGRGKVDRLGVGF